MNVIHFEDVGSCVGRTASGWILGIETDTNVRLAKSCAYGREPTACSRMADLLGRDSYSTRALHDGHVPIAPELDFFNPSVVQLEVEAGEDGRDCEI